MGDLVDETNCGPASQNCLDVHFLDLAAVILDALSGNDFQPLQKRRRVRTAVCFHDSHDHVLAIGRTAMRLVQHGVGLADAGKGAEVHPQGAAMIFLRLLLLE